MTCGQRTGDLESLTAPLPDCVTARDRAFAH